MSKHITQGFNEFESASSNAVNITDDHKDIPINLYLLKLKSIRDIVNYWTQNKIDWIKAVKKEMISLVENKMLKRGDKPLRGKKILAIFVFKDKITSQSYMGKLKACCVTYGDLQQKRWTQWQLVAHSFDLHFRTLYLSSCQSKNNSHKFEFHWHVLPRSNDLSLTHSTNKRVFRPYARV